MDELKGRQVAKSLQVKFTGTLGVLIFAKEKGFLHSVREIIDLISKTNFRISERLISETLKRCGA